MALLELEDVFPHIHFTTLQELYNDCGGNTSQVANFLTEDTAINLSDDVCSPVLNFNTRCDDLPSSGTYEVDSLSALLSSPSVHSEGRRPFRCPHCGHTYPSGDYRFCPHCGRPLQGEIPLDHVSARVRQKKEKGKQTTTADSNYLQFFMTATAKEIA